VLGLLQIAAAKEIAPLPALLFPLQSAPEKPGVRADPVQVGVESGDKSLERGAVVILVPKERPIPCCERLRHGLAAGIAADDGHEALVLLERVAELPRANLGGERIGADHEEEVVRGLDALEDLLQPFRGREDVLPVDPDVLPALGERGIEPLDEFQIAA
jgi:hypothetical protein